MLEIGGLLASSDETRYYWKTDWCLSFANYLLLSHYEKTGTQSNHCIPVVLWLQDERYGCRYNDDDYDLNR